MSCCFDFDFPSPLGEGGRMVAGNAGGHPWPRSEQGIASRFAGPRAQEARPVGPRGRGEHEVAP